MLQTQSGDGLLLLKGLGVDLSGVVQLGGHTVRRTHFNQGPGQPNVGFAIMRAVLEKLKQTPSVKIVTGAKVPDLASPSADHFRGPLSEPPHLASLSPLNAAPLSAQHAGHRPES